MSTGKVRIEVDSGTLDDGRPWSLYGWAERLAADLPPFTPDEAAQVGVVAARLDARTSTLDGDAA